MSIAQADPPTAAVAATAVPQRTRPWVRAAPVAIPAAVVAFFSFRSGGFFPGEPAIVGMALVAFLVLRVVVAERPVAAVSAGVIVLAAAFALLAVWTLVSSSWSGAAGRAILEYDRTLAYALGAIAMGTVARTARRLQWATWLLLAAILAACAAGLITRLAPDVWHQAPGIGEERLSFPLTYWNALGILGAIGAVLALGLTTSAREPRAVRLLAAAAAPVLATTVLLTFSRGALGAGVVGLLVVLAVGRPEGWLGGLVAPIAGSAVPILGAIHADVLTSSRYGVPAAIAQGHHVAVLLVIGIAVATALRRLAVPVDDWMVRRANARAPRPPLRTAAFVGAGVAAVLAALIIAGAPGFAKDQIHGFVHEQHARGAATSRLLQVANSGRVNQWRLALDTFRSQPLRGTGAGTYQTWWERGRPSDQDVINAHSLYLETLSDLGIVGLVLLLTAIGAVLWGFARLARGPERAVPAALFAAAIAWALHAGFDWDWQMPATTFWVFGIGALALARPPRAARAWVPSRMPRVAAALGCLVLAIVPALVMTSQARLDSAARQLADDDCSAAVDSALGSIGALGSRAEPYEILGFCDVRLGADALAVRALHQAVARDRRWWVPWYGLALVQGASGQDPRPAARHALELNPREPLTRTAARRFAAGDRRTWPRIAGRLKLPEL